MIMQTVDLISPNLLANRMAMNVERVAAQVDGQIEFQWRRAINGFSAQLSDKAVDAVSSKQC